MAVHPLLYPFGSVERWTSFLRHCLGWSTSELKVASTLLEQQLVPLLNGTEIALYLGISESLLNRMAAQPGSYYRRFSVPKKAGGTRRISAPRVFLKVVQRYVLDCILSPLVIDQAAVGFVRGRSLRDGASKHVGRPYVWNIDLTDFFPTIKARAAKAVFLDAGYPRAAAQYLTQLCTVGGHLPQGAPTSPALSNLVFATIDRSIRELSGPRSIVYTRYADDLSFSSKSPMAPDFMEEVTDRIRAAGFELNRDKCRLMGPACRREITGLTINERVSVPRDARRRLRALFHAVGLRPEEFIGRAAELRGHISWLSQHHPEEAEKYRRTLMKVLDAPSDAKN